MKTLILGGVRSGKSRLAESLAEKSGLPVTYIATATAGDDEMSKRIDAHKKRRPSGWGLVEEPLLLGNAVLEQSREGKCVLVDCLTLWLTNLLLAQDETLLQKETEALMEVITKVEGEIIMVSNETGMGVIPMGELSRRFCDEAGDIHKSLAVICDKVILTVAGLPQVIKG